MLGSHAGFDTAFSGGSIALASSMRRFFETGSGVSTDAVRLL